LLNCKVRGIALLTSSTFSQRSWPASNPLTHPLSISKIRARKARASEAVEVSLYAHSLALARRYRYEDSSWLRKSGAARPPETRRTEKDRAAGSPRPRRIRTEENAFPVRKHESKSNIESPQMRGFVIAVMIIMEQLEEQAKQ
jgi:hypothetical protein